MNRAWLRKLINVTKAGTCLALAAWCASPADAVGADPFPRVLPSERARAVSLLGGIPATGSGSACPLPRVHILGPADSGRAGRAARLLEATPSDADRRIELADGTLHYSTTAGRPDGVSAVDGDADGVPDLPQSVARGFAQARRLVVEQLDFSPPNIEAWFVELPKLHGYVVPAQETGGTARIFLDATPCGGAESLRRAAIQLYVGAVTRGVHAEGELPRSWARAVGLWVQLESEGGPDAAVAQIFSERIRRLNRGLFGVGDGGTGNALWLAFLDANYGRRSIAVALRELAQDGAPDVALDRALARATGTSLVEAFRDFQLWTTLVGEDARTEYFPFAEALSASPVVAQGLPALAVHQEAAISRWGGSVIRLEPDAHRGGMQLHFEGEFGGDWAVDLLLFDESNGLRRLPVPVSARGRGAVTVPLDGLSRAMMLVRNQQGDDYAPRRYTYSVHQELNYPFELTEFDVRADTASGAVVVQWETSHEEDLVGFDLVRRPADDSGSAVRLNPVWVPALGESEGPISYRFVDRTAEPGAGYTYQLVGVTRSGLSSRSSMQATYVSPGEGQRRPRSD